jgi:histidinol-phosphate aminotransferase
MKRPLRRHDDIRKKEKFHLDRNENPNAYIIFDKFIANLREEHLYEYPEMPKAYGYLSKVMSERQDHMLLTAGADDAMRLIFQYIERIHKHLPAPKITIPTPTYQMAKVYADMFGCVTNEIPYDRYENRFAIDLDNFEGDILYLANPDNPTGAYIEIDKLNRLIDRNPHTICIFDETYIEYVGDIQSMRHFVNIRPNIFVIRSLSKVYGAGAKVGCIISHPENIMKLNEFRGAYEISNLGLVLLQTAAEEKDQNSFTSFTPLDIVQETLYVKSKMEEHFENMGLDVMETRANFILIKRDAALERVLDEIAYFKILKIDNVDYIKIAVPDVSSASDIIEYISKRI